MADQEHGGLRRLGEVQHGESALAHLRDRARAAFQVGARQRLDGIRDQHVGADGHGGVEHLLRSVSQ
jgi:hypothetical protein